jgi:hypothetical protein
MKAKRQKALAERKAQEEAAKELKSRIRDRLLTLEAWRRSHMTEVRAATLKVALHCSTKYVLLLVTV